jgi:ribonuclease D
MDVGLNENNDQLSGINDQLSGIEELRITITAEEINNLPLKTFSGKISVISDPDQLVKVVEEIRSHGVVGFDTETRPSFKKGQIFQVSLLQLAIPKKVFLIRLNHTGVTRELASLFSNPRIIKAGVGIRDDLKALLKLRNFEPAGFFDLSTLAKGAGLQVESVKKLTALLLRFRISKSAQTSNWEVVTFTQKQIEYAATDAWVCLELYHKLKPKNSR